MLSFPVAHCAGSSATVDFSWQPIGSGIAQFLDLTVFDDGFAPDTFIFSGPLSTSVSSLRWEGILPGLAHFWRVNTLTDAGWITSETGTFVPCGSPVLLWSPILCEAAGTASVHFRWAPVSPPASQQWLDIAKGDGTFAPGTFQGHGPLAAEASALQLTGLHGNETFVFRVNGLSPVGWQASPPGELRTTCGPPGKIAFDGINLMNADGSNQIHLTNGRAPALSPDGQRVAFESTRDGNPEIYAMNVDGSALLRLTNDPAVDASPTWSPDGRRIAFSSNRASASSIYTMNADGSDVVRLTFTPNPDYDPAWSPDGSRIAYAATRDGNFEIYVMSVDGTGQTRVTRDGDVVNPDGRDPVQITSLGTDNQPAWSPDGRYVVFRRGGAPGDLHLIGADGSGMRLLATRAWEPSWSPDGSKIAFTSDSGTHDTGIYVMNADGSNRIRLASGSNPSWSW
jgi:hypothetical protein